MNNEDKVVRKTAEILISNVLKLTQGINSVAVAFSGGLDSSLLAYIIKNRTNTIPILYTIGFPGTLDFYQSHNAAESLLLSRTFISLDTKIVRQKLHEYQGFTKDNDRVSIAFSLPFYILLERIPQEHIASGHGADTLFGGFYKYLKSNDLIADIRKNYGDFLAKLPLRELVIAKKFNKTLILPFADQRLAKYVLTNGKELLIKEGKRKFLLQEVARLIGFPESIINTPKKAIQYSTGVSKALRHLS